MKLKFERIYIVNFMSFTDATIELDGNNYVAVKGINNNPKDNAKSNGSGKSTIFNAICWALTGETISGTKDVTNIYVDGDCLVDVEFTVNNDNYRIVRSQNHSNKTSLKVFVNDNDISGKGIRDTEKVLADRLPDLTAQFIGSVIILGQGLPHKFTDNTPAGRKEILETLSKSDYMIEDLKQRVTTVRGNVQAKQRELEDNKLKCETQINSAKSNIDKFTIKLTSMPDKSELEKEVHNNEHIIAELTSEKEDLQNEYETATNSYNDITNTLLSYQKEYNENIEAINNKYKSENDAASQKCMALESDIKSKKLEFNKLKNIRDICPTCGQKLIGVVKPDTTEIENAIKELEAELVTANADFRAINDKVFAETANYKNAYNEKVNQLNREKAQAQLLVKEVNDRLSKNNSNIVSATNKLAEAKAVIINYEVEQNSYKSQIKENEELIVELETNLKSYNNELILVKDKMDILSKFNTLLTRDFRGYLLKDTIEYIDKKCKYYSNIVFKNDDIQFVLDGNNINITIQGKDYSSLSGGEKQKVDLIIQFALRDMLCNCLNFSCNIIALDEVMDFLDATGCSTVIDLIQNACSDVSSIYVISHHTDLDIPYDSELIVMKDETGCSYVL